MPDMPPAVATETATVLVVEDEEPVRLAVQEALKSLRYRTLTATAGAEALALFREHGRNIDLVLSEMVMPEMGGAPLGAVRGLIAGWY